MTHHVQRLNDAGREVALGFLGMTVSYGIKRAYLRVIRDLEEALAPQGFTPPLLAALCIAAANPGIPPTRLATAMGHGRSRVSPLLDRLEADGLLRREPGAGRRGVGVRVTRVGDAALRKLHPILEAHERRITAALTEVARRDLAVALDHLAGQD